MPAKSWVNPPGTSTWSSTSSRAKSSPTCAHLARTRACASPRPRSSRSKNSWSSSTTMSIWKPHPKTCASAKSPSPSHPSGDPEVNNRVKNSVGILCPGVEPSDLEFYLHTHANSCHSIQPRHLGLHQTLRARVDAYFKENNLSRKGDWRLHLKTGVMMTLYFVPWALITWGFGKRMDVLGGRNGHGTGLGRHRHERHARRQPRRLQRQEMGQFVGGTNLGFGGWQRRDVENPAQRAAPHLHQR